MKVKNALMMWFEYLISKIFSWSENFKSHLFISESSFCSTYKRQEYFRYFVVYSFLLPMYLDQGEW